MNNGDNDNGVCFPWGSILLIGTCLLAFWDDERSLSPSVLDVFELICCKNIVAGIAFVCSLFRCCFIVVVSWPMENPIRWIGRHQVFTDASFSRHFHFQGKERIQYKFQSITDNVHLPYECSSESSLPMFGLSLSTKQRTSNTKTNKTLYPYTRIRHVIYLVVCLLSLLPESTK